MALDTRTPRAQVPITPAFVPAEPQQQMRHRLLRGTLAVLAALIAFTTIQGAIFVVPTMPRAWLHQGLLTPFADYTIPALALGILCGGSALVALVTLLMRVRIGALLTVVAGILMVGFELVEIVVVGFTPVLYPTQPPAWLQVFYLIAGSAMALLGGFLWKMDQNTTPLGK
jgi:hypothetical protein